jgi:competence protein ComEC
MQNINVMPRRAPLLYPLVGLILGLTLARLYPRYDLSEIGLILCLVCTTGLLFLTTAASTPLKGILWGPLFLGITTLFSWNYGILRFPPIPNMEVLQTAAREQKLELEIIQVFRPGQFNSQTVNGIAKLLSPTEHGYPKAGSHLYLKLDLFTLERSAFQKGTQVEAKGVLQPLNITSGKDANYFNKYLRNQNVYFSFGRNENLILKQEASNFRLFCVRQKARLLNILEAGSEGAENSARVYLAMLLGDKSSLTKAQQDRFQMTGAMHLFAISGLHVGVIAAALAQFFNLLRLPRSCAPLLALPLLYLYVEITGGMPSAMRAFLMTLFFWLSYTLQRQRNPFAALIASAIVVLLIEPQQLFSLGFQLSYLVVSSILLFGLPLHRILIDHIQLYCWLPQRDWTLSQRFIQKTVNSVALLFAISLSAWLASAPFSLGHFGYLSLSAIILNMLLVNLAAIVICTGCLSMGLGLISLTGIAAFINHAAWLVISGMDGLTQIASIVPYSIIYCASFPLGMVYLISSIYFFGLLVVNNERKLQTQAIFAVPPVMLILLIAGTYFVA